MFVPNGPSRKDTAVLLVGTAAEFGIDQRSIRALRSGFEISDELASLIYDEDTTKTSGNRAAKKNSKE